MSGNIGHHFRRGPCQKGEGGGRGRGGGRGGGREGGEGERGGSE